MISDIHRTHRKNRDHYRFSVKYERNNSWQFTFRYLEDAKLCHTCIVEFDRIVHFIFERFKAGAKYKELEPTLNRLAEKLDGSWPLDFLYYYLNQLFLLSGPEDAEWFCYAAFCRMVTRKALKRLKPPVIRRYEEKFTYIEDCLEQDGKWKELAYVQVARDTGFRVGELESIEWDDIQFPRINLQKLRKMAEAPSYGVICDKTYATLQKLERTSESVFGKAGERLRRTVRKYADDNTFRIHDYRRCYALRMIWEEIVLADNPGAKEADGCERQ